MPILCCSYLDKIINMHNTPFYTITQNEILTYSLILVNGILDKKLTYNLNVVTIQVPRSD